MYEEKDVIRIAFVMPNLNISGIGRALLSLLDTLHQRGNVETQILLFQKQGALLKYIPSRTTVEQIKGMGYHEAFRSAAVKLLRLRGIRIFFSPVKKLYHRFGYRGKVKKSFKFDITVGYQDGASTWYAANIESAKKVAFVHTDFIKAQYNPNLERKVYSQFDQIYCVSRGAKESFLQMLPEFSGVTSVFPTIINPERIRELASKAESFQDDFLGLRILTVGRLSHEKGIDKAVRVLKRLLDEGYKVKWYIIGQGPEGQSLFNLVNNMNLKQEFIFLGSMENPYGFMSACDIYVQPSNYEGYSITVAESRALYKPIVACDFSGAREQLTSGINGLICGLGDEQLYNSIKELLDNQELRDLFTLNLSKQKELLTPFHRTELEEFLKLM